MFTELNDTKESAEYHLQALQQALLHQTTQDYSRRYSPLVTGGGSSPEAANNQDDSWNRSQLGCPHVSCSGNRTNYKVKRNLQRHYSKRVLHIPRLFDHTLTIEIPDVAIEEKCPFCMRSFRNLRSFTFHCEYCKKQLGQSIQSKARQEEIKKRMKLLRKYAASMLDRDRRSHAQSSENCVQHLGPPSPHMNVHEGPVPSETFSANQFLMPQSISANSQQLNPKINPEALIQPSEVSLPGDCGALGNLLVDRPPAETVPHRYDTYMRAPLLTSFTIIEPTTLDPATMMPESALPSYNGNSIQIPACMSFNTDSSVSPTLVRAPLLTASTIIGPTLQPPLNQSSVLQGHTVVQSPYDSLELAQVDQCSDVLNTDQTWHFQAFQR